MNVCANVRCVGIDMMDVVSRASHDMEGMQ